MATANRFSAENQVHCAYVPMSDLNPVEIAEAAGFDIALMEHSLALTPEQRASEHQGALDLVWELEQIRNARNEESQ